QRLRQQGGQLHAAETGAQHENSRFHCDPFDCSAVQEMQRGLLICAPGQAFYTDWVVAPVSGFGDILPTRALATNKEAGPRPAPTILDDGRCSNT
ncbi:MAG: hypothetical protein AAB654_22875, partial [Acidobacteriota bacterium]